MSLWLRAKELRYRRSKLFAMMFVIWVVSLTIVDLNVIGFVLLQGICQSFVLPPSLALAVNLSASFPLSIALGSWRFGESNPLAHGYSHPSADLMVNIQGLKRFPNQFCTDLHYWSPRCQAALHPFTLRREGPV